MMGIGIDSRNSHTLELWELGGLPIENESLEASILDNTGSKTSWMEGGFGKIAWIAGCRLGGWDGLKDCRGELTRTTLGTVGGFFKLN